MMDNLKSEMLSFNPVDKPTVTVVVQYPKTTNMFICEVTFEDDLEFALLQATFALKDKIKEEKERKEKEKSNAALIDELDVLLDKAIAELTLKLTKKEKEVSDDIAL